MTAHQCPRCGLTLSQAVSQCPNCNADLQMGATPNAAPNEPNAAPVAKPSNLIQAYFQKVWSILTEPSRFFARMPVSGGLGEPLAFALITHWLGSLAGYLWRVMTGTAGRGFMNSLLQLAGIPGQNDIDSLGRHADWLALQGRALQWAWGAGPVIIDPFLNLISILITSFFVFLGARLLVTAGKNGAPSEITYESAARIVAYGMTPAILAVFPFVGGLAAALYAAVVTIIGAREVYRVGNGRATLVALFPKLLILGILGTGLLLFAGILIKLLSSAIH